jgi:hypothetical protein
MRTTTGDWSLRRRAIRGGVSESQRLPHCISATSATPSSRPFSVRWYSKRSGHSVADAAEHTGADETVQAVGEHVARDPKTLEQLIEAMASDPYVAFAPPSGNCWRLRASPWRSTRRG